MNLTEMHSIAANTLGYFIQTMPDAPFTVDDIVIEFAPKVRMAERARALCEQYVQGKIINESQARELTEGIDANALIGREKSAVIARINSKRSEQAWREVFFHEFMHIYCAKLEMNGEHFIEIYGSGTTPENPDMTPAERTNDGLLVDGYAVWSEFIAQYYTLKHTETRHPAVDEVSGYINKLLYSVGRMGNKGDMYALSLACARLLSCSDAEETVSILKEPNDEMPTKQRAFLSCLLLLHEHLQDERPWEISEEFIADLGTRYVFFKVMNSNLLSGS